MADHATLKTTKYFLNRSQADNSLDDRLKPICTEASIWFEIQLGFSITATTGTDLIASQYAAGLWEQINAQDKSKDTKNMIEAKSNMQEFLVQYNKRTFPSTDYESEFNISPL